MRVSEQCRPMRTENTRIHRPGKCKKTRGKRWNSCNFQSLTEQWTPRNKRLLEFTGTHCPRKYKKLLRTQEDMIFSKRSSNDEHWKKKRFLEFTRFCCQRKCKKTSENAGTHNNFRAFTGRWTLENMRFHEFPWIHLSGKIQENKTKLLWTRECTMLSLC